MYRLLYLGEALRTERCPYHDGKMDTGLWVSGGIGCCDGSGWLENDLAARAERLEQTRQSFASHDWGDHRRREVETRIKYCGLPADFMETVFGGAS